MSQPPPPPPLSGGQIVNPTLGKDREKLPGWNDPPALSDSRTTAAPGNKLNKRVGYPVAQSLPGQVAPPGSSRPPPATVMPLSTPPILQTNLPPPPSCSTTKSPGLNNASTSLADPGLEDSILEIEAVVDRLNCILDELSSGPDIRKRVAAMQSKWDSLDDKVKLGVSQLISHLSAGKYDEAERVQKSLAVGYPSQCAAWIVAFKRIVNDSKSKSGPSADKVKDPVGGTGLYMVPADN